MLAAVPCASGYADPGVHVRQPGPEHRRPVAQRAAGDADQIVALQIPEQTRAEIRRKDADVVVAQHQPVAARLRDAARVALGQRLRVADVDQLPRRAVEQRREIGAQHREFRGIDAAHDERDQARAVVRRQRRPLMLRARRALHREPIAFEEIRPQPAGLQIPAPGLVVLPRRGQRFGEVETHRRLPRHLRRQCGECCQRFVVAPFEPRQPCAGETHVGIRVAVPRAQGPEQFAREIHFARIQGLDQPLQHARPAAVTSAP